MTQHADEKRVRLQAKVHPDIVAWLRKVAKREKISLSQAIERVLERAMQRDRKR